MILQSYIIQYKNDFSTREDGGEIITAGIERTHAKWSTYFLTMVPDENYLDAASRLVVRGWDRNVVYVSTGSVRPQV